MKKENLSTSVMPSSEKDQVKPLQTNLSESAKKSASALQSTQPTTEAIKEKDSQNKIRADNSIRVGQLQIDNRDENQYFPIKNEHPRNEHESAGAADKQEEQVAARPDKEPARRPEPADDNEEIQMDLSSRSSQIASQHE